MVKITEELLNETFENTFLTLVAYEVRFPTDLTIQNRIPAFQGSIKEDFPVYSEGFTLPVQFQPEIKKSNLLNYAFKNYNEYLEIYLNSYSVLGIRTRAYSNFRDFSNMFLNIINSFMKICSINKFTRLGLRYINIIPLKESLIDSNQLKNLYFNSILNDNFNNFNFENQHMDLKYKNNDYEIHQQFFYRKNLNNFYEVVLDIDNSFKGNINIKNQFSVFKGKINDLHSLIKIKFFEMIRDDFLKELRKKVNRNETV